MRIMITGSNGQLGRALLSCPKIRHHEVLPVDMAECDILNEPLLHSTIEAFRPDVILHCAAFTAVDRAESDREKAYEINVTGTRNVASEAERIGSKLVLISSDYVFHGDGDEPFSEDGETNPLSWYGQTKLMAEREGLQLCSRGFVVRTSWLFGDGHNFVKAMLNKAKTEKEIRVVCDQVGSPTYAKDLAEFLLYLISTEQYGVYHFTNQGFVSWADFAKEIMRKRNLDVTIVPVSTDEFHSAAKRPHNSRLSCEHLLQLGYPLPRSWKEALSEYFAEITERDI